MEGFINGNELEQDSIKQKVERAREDWCAQRQQQQLSPQGFTLSAPPKPLKRTSTVGDNNNLTQEQHQPPARSLSVGDSVAEKLNNNDGPASIKLFDVRLCFYYLGR